MEALIEVICLCTIFFVICYVGTGTDEKNIKSFACYPDEIQAIIRNNEELKDKIRTKSTVQSFVSNIVVFIIVLFAFGFIIRTDSWKQNFITLLLLGETLNAFDLLIIDLIWWRNTKRVRFKGTEHLDAAYKNPNKHIQSFLKGVLLFVIVALIDTAFLSLF